MDNYGFGDTPVLESLERYIGAGYLRVAKGDTVK